MLTVVQQALFAAFLLAVAFGAVWDVLTMTIPNRLSLAMLAVFVVIAPLVAMGWQTFLLHCAAGAIVLAFGFTLFSFGLLGGGDAKFAAAIALWLGLGHTVEFILTTTVFGGLLALAVLAFRRMPLPVAAVRQPWLERLHDGRKGLPYGVALAAAAFVIYPHTIWAGIVSV